MKRIDDWDRGIKHCEDYVITHGDLLCNCRYVADDGYNLGQWISRKRHAYKSGQLTDSEIAQLTRLGVLHLKSERSWEDGCKHAAEYIMSTGNYDVPFEYCCADGFRLGVWVSYARNCLRNPGQRKLTDSQRIMFLNLGIPINKHEDSWHTGFKHAEVFWHLHQHLNVPAKFVCEDGYRLGAWIRRQRNNFRYANEKPEITRKMILQHSIKLNRIGMLWTTDEILWCRNFFAALDLYNAHGYFSIYDAKNDYQMSQLREWAKMTRNYLSGKSDKFTKLIKLYDEKIKMLFGGKVC